MLFKFGKTDSPLCSFCKVVDETPPHLFYNCAKTKLFQNQLKEFITNYKNLSLRQLIHSLSYITECHPRPY